MKQLTTFVGLALLSLSALAGCKSNYEKFADETCACKDEKCFKDTADKYKDALGGGKMKDMEAKMATLGEADKKAFERGLECAIKFAMSDKK
jgi:hypothetical protein